MSERFQVPEPSAKALDAADAKMDCAGYRAHYVVRAAFAVDVPAIVRQAEAVALDDMTEMLWGLFERNDISEACHNWTRARLASRFGPVPQEEELAACPHGPDGCPHCRPAPSAQEPRIIEGASVERVPLDATHFTDAERASLARLTQALPFIEKFTRDYLAQVDLPAGLVRGFDTIAAARVLVEGK